MYIAIIIVSQAR